MPTVCQHQIEITGIEERSTMDEKDIQKQLEEILSGMEDPACLASPEAMDKLKELGLTRHDKEIPTEEVIRSRIERAALLSEKVPPVPERLPASISFLFQDVRECIIYGLYGAAITLSCNLIEFALKQATFIKEAGGYRKTEPEKWDEFEDMELGPAINRAKTAGLVTSKMSNALHEFRTDVRNPYGHYNIKKITDGTVAEDVKLIDLKTGEINTRNIDAGDNPLIQGHAKRVVDAHLVEYVFKFAYVVVVELFSRINSIDESEAED